MSAHRFLGKYEIVQRLGRGGMAEVYQARDPLLDRLVAIKVILPQLAAEDGFAERFRREARAVASLRHPHIVQLFDFGQLDDQWFMVMEYLSGGTLRDRLAALNAQGRRLPPDEVARLAQAIADALDYAHGQGIVHRDVKPANILFTARDEPVLTDFGIIKLLDEATQQLTRGIIGSPAYMSPEQAGGGAIDLRSDVYSLGVVLYELVAGRPPFQGDSPTAVLLKHLTEPPPSPRQFNPHLSPAVERAVLTALAKAPDERFASAGDLARAFRAALADPAAAPDAADARRGGVDAQAETALDVGGGVDTVTDPHSPARPAASPADTSAAPVPAPVPAAPPAATARRRIPAFDGDARLLLAVVLAAVGGLLGIALVVALQPHLPAAWTGALILVVALAFTGSAAAALLGLLRARSSRERRRSGVLLALVPLLALAWAVWLAASRSTNRATLFLAIGEFDGSRASRKVDFARRIYEQLQSELADLGEAVELVRTGETYSDSRAARARGADLKATVVIWGWYDDAGVSPHVEALQAPLLRRETVSVPFLLETASAAEAGGSPPPEPRIRDLARFVRTPTQLPDLDLFVRSGPQQLSHVATAILGLAFSLGGDSKRALQLLDRAIATAPAGSGEFVGLELMHFQRATELYRQGRLADAIRDLEQAIALKPDLVVAHQNLAIAYAESCTPTRRLDAAIRAGETAVRLAPDDVSARQLLGDLYRQAGRYEQAIAQFRDGLRVDPNRADLHELLAEALAAGGQGDAARMARQTAITLREQAGATQSADKVRRHLALGDAYLAASEYDKALIAYRAVLELDPANPTARRGLGLSFYWKSEFVACEREYREWVRAVPANGIAHLILGLFLAEKGDTAEAVAELEAAVRLAPCNAAAHLALARLYWAQGDQAKSNDALKAARAIEAPPPRP